MRPSGIASPWRYGNHTVCGSDARKRRNPASGIGAAYFFLLWGRTREEPTISAPFRQSRYQSVLFRRGSEIPYPVYLPLILYDRKSWMAIKNTVTVFVSYCSFFCILLIGDLYRYSMLSLIGPAMIFIYWPSVHCLSVIFSLFYVLIPWFIPYGRIYAPPAPRFGESVAPENAFSVRKN